MSIIKPLNLPEGQAFKIEIIDTWEITITPLDGTLEGNCSVDLPGKPYTALRIQKA